MFQYGLVGNTIFYGGLGLVFGYIGWEIHNITTYAAKLDEKEAREILGLLNTDKTLQHKKNDLAQKEIQKYTDKMKLNRSSVETIQQSYVVKDDFDSGKQADI